jgi:alginate O-acetyltransferase complex protein AlgI
VYHLPVFSMSGLLHQLQYDPKNPLLFNNGFFVYFFAVFISLYYLCRKKFLLRSYLVTFFSLYFFYKACGWFVGVVLFSAVGDYILSNLIHRQKNKLYRKLLLLFSVFLNLGLLVYFKYTNFLIELSGQLLHVHTNPLNILLPVGISFYTFENLSYTIDVYKDEFVPEKKFINYLLFLSFFPKLVMGPIVRAKDFIPQLSQPYVVQRADFTKGFYLIASGLFKKLIISDFLTLNLVNYIFDDPARHTGLECLVAVFAYAIVIYCDFSGYSDVAIGLAKWLGINIPANFNLPYKSTSITEFWRKWHISLSSWLRDYLYIFWLGGNRKGKLRTYFNLFATMLLGGLWHGAKLTFVVWGALHGIALAFHKIWMIGAVRFFPRLKRNLLTDFISGAFTFLFVCFCWIFFKAANFDIAYDLIKQIGTDFSPQIWLSFYENYKPVIYVMLLGYALHFIPRGITDALLRVLEKAPMIVYVFIFMGFVLLYAQVNSGVSVMPIYLQF